MQQVDPALTIVPVDHIRKPEDDEEEEEESSEEEEEVDLPPGPISSEHCTVGGPGFVGGSAKSSISFYVTAKDETGKRIRDGGAYVTATVNPGRVARAGGAELVFADIRDNSDGTYTATYTVEARGDYELSVEVNGSPIGGSPFPVFFSPPEPAASNEPPASAAATGTPQSPAYPVASFMPGGTAAVPSVTAPDGTVLNTANAALSLQPPSVLGPQAHKAGVTFPKDQAALDRTLLVGNLNPSVTDEQIRQLFGFCGAVIGLNRVGDQQQYMLIEYTYPTEAAAASAMHGMQVVDRKIAVEQAAVAERAKEPGDANPYAQIQAHQLQHVMAAQIQQSSLAAQVAAMRVQAKTNPASATAPGLAQNSASQKNAALAAIAALSRRLGGSTDAQLPRPESPTKVKKRREVSPTIRKRDSRQSRSPSARRRFDRRLSPPIKRRDSVERRPYKRDSSRDRRRGRSGSRERARPKHAERRCSPSRERPARRDARDEPSRRRDRDRSRERTADRRQQGDRVSSRHRDDDSLRRHRDNRDRDNKYGSERPRERDEGGRRDRDTERRSNKDEDRRRSGQEDRRKSEARDNGHASPSNGKASMPRDASSSPKVNGCLSEEASRPADEAQKSPVPDVDKGAQKDEQQQKQAEEAQQLRERALEALSAAAAKPPATEGDGASDDLSRKPESLEGIEGHKRGRSMSHSPEQEERKRKKEKKDKKHKKHKRHR